MNFLNRSKPKKEKLTVINQDKALATLKKEVQDWIKNKGQSIAENFTWEKDKQIDWNLFPPVVHIRESHQSILNYVGALYDKNLSIYKTTFNKYESEFEENTSSDVDSDIKSLESERKEVLEEAFDDHKNDIDDKKEEAKELKTEIKNNKIELKSLTKHNLKSRKIIAGIIMLLMVLGEIYLNKDAFSYAGFAETATIFIGIAIATVTFMLGIAKASILRKPDWKLPTKVLASLGLLILIASVYFVLGSIRVSLLESQGENEELFGLSPFHFVAFNLAFYTGIFACKYFIYPSPQMIADNDKYAISLKKLKDNEKKLAKLKKSIFNSHQEKSKKRQHVQGQYAKKINPIKESIKTENNTIKKSALDFNTELALARNFYKQINADYKTSVADLLNALNLFGDKNNVQILMSKIDDLQNPFGNIQLITIKTETASNGVLDETTTPEKTAWEIMAENQSDEASHSFINPKDE